MAAVIDGIKIEERISVLRAWRFWQHEINSNPKKYGNYVFPGTIYSWRKAGDPCPICKGSKVFLYDGAFLFCLCYLLKTIEDLQYSYSYETPVKLASLHSLNPFTAEGLEKQSKDGGIKLEEAKKYLMSWVKKPGRWIFITGGTGSGKTTMLRALKSAFPPGLTMFITMGDFQRHLFASIEDKTVEEFTKCITKPPILLLDDFGAEHNNAWTLDTLQNIVNTRYNYWADLPMVVSSNYSTVDLLSSTDKTMQRIVSRLIGHENAMVLTLTQPDYRIYHG